MSISAFGPISMPVIAVAPGLVVLNSADHANKWISAISPDNEIFLGNSAWAVDTTIIIENASDQPIDITHDPAQVVVYADNITPVIPPLAVVGLKLVSIQATFNIWSFFGNGLAP